MTKRTLYLFFTMLCSVAWTQPSVEQKIRDNIAANKIKSQISFEHKYTDGQPQASGTKTSVTLYNTSGDITKVTTYNAKGLVMNVENYRYDGAGNKLEYTRYSGDNETQVAYQKITKYDDDNNIVEENGFDGVEKFHNQYSYDALRNLSEIHYRKNSVLKERRVFKKDGLKTHVSIYNPSGKMISKILLVYDKKGSLLEETVYGINQDIIERKTFDYDETEKLKAESKYKLNKMTIRTTYNYTPNGDLAEIIEESPGSGKFIKKSYTYSPKGLITEIKWRRRADEDFNSITYKYDSRGICTESITFYPSTNFRTLTKYDYAFY